jgi:hypothetical protein
MVVNKVSKLKFPDYTSTLAGLAELGLVSCADLKLPDHDEPSALFCTRLKNHSGRHAAGNGLIITATWR